MTTVIDWLKSVLGVEVYVGWPVPEDKLPAASVLYRSVSDGDAIGADYCIEQYDVVLVGQRVGRDVSHMQTAVHELDRRLVEAVGNLALRSVDGWHHVETEHQQAAEGASVWRLRVWR